MHQEERKRLKSQIFDHCLTGGVLLCAAACGSGGDSDEAASGGSGATTSSEQTPAEVVSLHETYADHFAIGAAVDIRSFHSHRDLLSEHFNSITTENEMKFDALQRSEGEFRFVTADEIADFAMENDMEFRGHALVWHRQNPGWLFVDEEGEQASPELLLERMQAHIAGVVGHFAGRVTAWDVVNEAIMNDGSLRSGDEEEDDQKSLWFEILGESYIADAFRFAHEVDPDAKLFYNDYYNYMPVRRDAIYELLSGLLDDGVPVHGVGLQCHIGIEPSSDPELHSYHQTIDNIEEAIMLYASLGLEVHITELDVSLYVGGEKYEPEDFYTLETFTQEIQQQQAERYRELFAMFREHSDVITNVSFWGIADDNTWLSEFSSGRQDFPLLFDVDHAPKPAFLAVVDF